MSRVRDTILQYLADGQQHSGAGLAATLGVTRAAVARQVTRLRAEGWDIHGQAGAGYRLRGPGRPLRRRAIEEAAMSAGERIAAIDLLSRVASTSDWLAGVPLPADGAARVCVAEHQTAGRGRRGRVWLASPGGSICLSIGRMVPLAPADLVPMGLVTGIAVADTLAAHGVGKVGLKWPNDVEVEGSKLGGILVDVAGESAGPTRVVLGIGLNHDLGAPGPVGLDRPVTDLVRASSGSPPARDTLAGRVTAAVVRACDEFAARGFGAFRERWIAYDCLAGRAVRLESVPDESVDGHALGIDTDGALLVEVNGERRRFLAADVSARVSA